MKIGELEIKTSQVKKQLKFYTNTLGLEIQNYSEESFEVILGYSVLRFVHGENATPYHIAIHIPDRQEEKALDWVKERAAVLKSRNEEIIDFSNWNARSVYFYDADKNIMELIARRSFKKPHSAIFSERNLLGIAEVGMATDDIEKKFEFLHKRCALEVFDGSFDKFCAIGDDEGLLITVDKDTKTWFPTEDHAYASEFKINFFHSGKYHQFNFEKDEISNYQNIPPLR